MGWPCIESSDPNTYSNNEDTERKRYQEPYCNIKETDDLHERQGRRAPGRENSKQAKTARKCHFLFSNPHTPLIAPAKGVALRHGGSARRGVERVVAKKRVLEKLDYPPDGNHDKEDKESPKEERFLFFSSFLAPEVRDVDRHAPEIDDERKHNERDSGRVDYFNDVESQLLKRLRRGVGGGRRSKED